MKQYIKLLFVLLLFIAFHHVVLHPVLFYPVSKYFVSKIELFGYVQHDIHVSVLELFIRVQKLSSTCGGHSHEFWE